MNDPTPTSGMVTADGNHSAPLSDMSLSIFGLMRNPPADPLSLLNNPKFEEAGKTHDWRNHVPDELIQIWDSLEQETRAALYFVAEINADREEWE